MKILNVEDNLLTVFAQEGVRGKYLLKVWKD